MGRCAAALGAQHRARLYVSQLRKTLAEGGPSGLETRPSGYLLAPAPGELDLHRFNELRAEGERAYAQGDHGRAAGRLSGALALWRGPALADVPQGPRLRAAADRLDLLRLDALERRIAADLWLGGHRRLIPELTELSAAHPLHEALHAHLMVALYQGHQTSQALTVYDRLRRRLADELGADPGPALRELHVRMLESTEVTHFEQCLPARPPAGPGAALPPLPAGHGAGPPVVHLPRLLPGPVLRRAQLREADTRLGEAGGASGPGILAITGPPGVGKTSFAAHLAHRAADLFPDGRIWLTLRDDDGRPLPPRETLLRILRRIRPAEAARFPPASAHDLDDMTLALAGAVRGRRILLVLDDVHSEAQLRPLRTGECTLLTTGTACAPDAAWSIALGPLDRQDSLALLSHAAGPVIEQDPRSAAAIAERCEHLPLALRGAAAWLASHPSWPARMLATRLDDPRTRLDARRPAGTTSARRC